MEDFKNKISSLRSSVKKLEESNEKMILNSLLEVIDGLSLKVEELTVNQEAIQENIQYMDDDLSGIQEELFEELSFEDLDDIEDEYVEITCNSCSKPIFIEKSAMNENENIPCPYCGKNIK
ncbi:CD1247 N-terminal domain-containing protein [Clostridium chrysemydis]|uniref:CD1247 N-terminal domain-containing protein n=1 Tax=Clostridium chrysemydis TaxID=2665504 RepID=UPI001883EA0B|nr:CD1247 N-terminal domain-containing protein [Clostridium chrysemydis]